MLCLTRRGLETVLRHRARPRPYLRRGKGSNPFSLVEYASYDYQDLLREHSIRQSMSAKGDCYDNACSESFFATIKKELIHRKRFRTRSWARLEVIDHILWYNSERIHSYLDDMSPLEFEQQYYNNTICGQ